MTIALILAAYQIGNTDVIITDIMNAAGAIPFPNAPEPFFNGESHMQHVSLAQQNLETLQVIAREKGCLVFTRPPHPRGMV